jgi:hypothetical protein
MLLLEQPQHQLADVAFPPGLRPGDDAADAAHGHPGPFHVHVERKVDQSSLQLPICTEDRPGALGQHAALRPGALDRGDAATKAVCVGILELLKFSLRYFPVLQK